MSVLLENSVCNKNLQLHIELVVIMWVFIKKRTKCLRVKSKFKAKLKSWKKCRAMPKFQQTKMLCRMVMPKSMSSKRQVIINSSLHVKYLFMQLLIYCKLLLHFFKWMEFFKFSIAFPICSRLGRCRRKRGCHEQMEQWFGRIQESICSRQCSSVFDCDDDKVYEQKDCAWTRCSFIDNLNQADFLC